MGIRNATHRFHPLAAAIFPAVLISCGIFEPRTPEDPSQASLNFRPPTDPVIVIANLQSAIDQKNVANYASCFADPMKVGRPFLFTPSAEASAQYAGVFSSWSFTQEQSYFQNLVAKSSPAAFSNLLLTLKTSAVTADSVIYSYDYILTFEHNEIGFPKTARGNLQFTLVTDNSNFWTIYRWNDFKTGGDITWSMFKGKFSN
jgi:hypothetical protein